MGYKVELDEQDWKRITEVLGELPSKMGVYPYLVQIVDQVNGQIRYYEELRRKNEAEASSNTEPV